MLREKAIKHTCTFWKPDFGVLTKSQDYKNGDILMTRWWWWERERERKSNGVSPGPASINFFVN